MKLKQACYDPAFCRMGFKRFAPLGILYTVFLVLLTVASVNLGQNMHSSIVNGLYSFFSYTVLIQCGYALILAELLLGDLYVPRLCYAIHSLPVTRGGWFGTQVIQGILSVIPGILLSGGLMAVSMTRFRILIPIWMGVAMLQFLFFFGIALLCGVCAGNRIGAALLYGIVNFGDLFVLWARLKIFSPLIYGMYIPTPSAKLCPVYLMLSKDVFKPEYQSNFLNSVPDGPTAFFDSTEILNVNINPGSIWMMAALAVLGCFAIFLAVKLLQRRRPECAGDLLAFPVMKPVILVLCTFFSGIVFHAVSGMFEWNIGYIMLAVGLVLGYYGCLMLLERQVNVFTRKHFLPLGVMGLVVILALGFTGLDLFGVAYRVPEADQVEKAELSVQYAYYDSCTAATPEEIEAVLTLQQDALEEHRSREAARPLMERIFGNEEDEIKYEKTDDTYEKTGQMFIIYTLKNGSTLSRSYQYHETSPNLQILQEIFSRPENVFSNHDFQFHSGSDVYDLLDHTDLIQVRCWHGANEYTTEKSFNITSPDEWRELLDAMLKDCEEARMAQIYSLHPDVTYQDRIYIYYPSPRFDGSEILYIDLYEDCENTLNWLIDHGYHGQLPE